MSTIVIKTDKENSKILAALARKLGAKVLDVTDDQFEDYALGALMDDVQTGEIVPKSAILKKLKAEWLSNSTNLLKNLYRN